MRGDHPRREVRVEDNRVRVDAAHARGKVERAQRLGRRRRRRVDVDEHEGLRVAAERVGEQLRQLRVPVRDVIGVVFDGEENLR